MTRHEGSGQSQLPPTHTLEVAGRTIAYCVLGDTSGTPVLAAHGSPGSRYQLLPLHAAAEHAGIRLIALDRPGVGLTSPDAARGFDTGAADAIAVLDSLELARVTALGFSGGGGYSLALALSAPERIERVVLACGMIPGAPRTALAGRIPLITTLYRVTVLAPWLAAAMLDGRGPFKSTRAANFDAWPEADRRVMEDVELQALLAADGVEGVRQGSRAAVDDLRRYSRSIPLNRVRQPVQLLHGVEDGNVPIGVARWAQTQLPRATLREFEGQGHYFAATNPELVIDALLEQRIN